MHGLNATCYFLAASKTRGLSFLLPPETTQAKTNGQHVANGTRRKSCGLKIGQRVTKHFFDCFLLILVKKHLKWIIASWV